MNTVRRWSVSIVAEGDRTVEREEVVELADAVAGVGGVATGIGTCGYGAQIVIAAADRGEAIAVGTEVFQAAAARAGLPDWPVVRAEAIGEHEEDGFDEYAVDEVAVDEVAVDEGAEPT